MSKHTDNSKAPGVLMVTEPLQERTSGAATRSENAYALPQRQKSDLEIVRVTGDTAAVDLATPAPPNDLCLQ